MKHDKGPPITPTEDLVTAACKTFDEENAVTEEALEILFKQYPRNDNHPHVLLKVVALNRLYSTNIFAVHDMAKHIYAQQVDSALEGGSPDIVSRIAVVRNGTTGKERDNYSFATKYCSWHNQASYPIWDDHVHRYLWRLQERDRFAPSFKASADLWQYAKFRDVVIALWEHYRLGGFNFKAIDKFLWSAGRRPSAMAATPD